jgi:hypothetical protein
MRDALIHAGSIAFGGDIAIAEGALQAAGLVHVKLVKSGPCTQHGNLTRYIVEVSGEHDGDTANAWMDRVEETLKERLDVGLIHRCVG